MTVGIGNSYQVVEDVEDSEWEDLDQVVIGIEDANVIMNSISNRLKVSIYFYNY